MKLRVIQGQKGQQQKPEDKAENKPMEDYYAKERPRSQEMEQAEGDEDIVDQALKDQEIKKQNKGSAA
jgi:hypothetical protein